MTFGYGAVAKYTYDADYRVTRIQVGSTTDASLIIDRSYSWTGDIVNSIIDNKNPGTTPGQYGSQTQTFTYTPTRRLATANGYYGALAWTYDANGNRLTEKLGTLTSTYAYPATSNRLTSVTPAGGSARSFYYYGDGSILADTRIGALGMNFEYDMDRRLSKAYQTNAPANGGTYDYDAFDRLASRKVTSGATTTTTLYVHDLNNHIIAETDAAGVTRREYIWLNDLPIAVVDQVNTASPQIYFVHTDHLGRPARMVNYGWIWVWDVIYAPFGGVSAIWDTTTKQDMRFPGQWFQLESGLAYNWHRHYDASLGRYMQPDPIGYAGGRSLYGYVGGNPLAMVDPDGLEILLGEPPIVPRLNLPRQIEKMIERGANIPEDALNGPRETIPRLSGKEGAKDVPSYCKGQRPTIRESGKDFADRVGKGQYGDDWDPINNPRHADEFQKMQKYGDRNFRIPQDFFDKFLPET